MYIEQGFSDWDALLPFSVFSMNIHSNQSTGFAPFDLVYGRIPRLPIDVALNFSNPLHHIDIDSYAAIHIKKHFTQAITIIQENITKAQKTYKHEYDKKTCIPLQYW